MDLSKILYMPHLNVASPVFAINVWVPSPARSKGSIGTKPFGFAILNFVGPTRARYSHKLSAYMVTELDVLKLVSERLTATQIQFMLTGSFALAFYATPRMTRDLDLVVRLSEHDVSPVIEAFSDEFYVDPDDAHTAVQSRRMFNLMHLQSGIKVDFIIRKDSEYRQVEFERRRAVRFGGIDTWIVSREDLILSKLLWSQESNSETQRRDVAALIHISLDWVYLRQWADSLGVSSDLERYLI